MEIGLQSVVCHFHPLLTFDDDDDDDDIHFALKPMLPSFNTTSSTFPPVIRVAGVRQSVRPPPFVSPPIFDALHIESKYPVSW